MHTLAVVHVVIVGCGRVGSSLSRSLLDNGHSVAIIDRNREAFNRLGSDDRATRIEGIGFDRDRLLEAGIEEADALAAVTNGDNSNVLVARVARETFGIEHVVARIYDPRRAAIYQRLGLATVATVAWTTDQVLRRLMPTAHPAEWTDPTAHLSVIERGVPAVWAGKPIADLEASTGVRVVGIGRLGSAMVATSELFAQEGDLLYLAVAADGIETVDRALS